MPCLSFSWQSSLAFFLGRIWKLVRLMSPPGKNDRLKLCKCSSAFLAHIGLCPRTTAHTFVPVLEYILRVHSFTVKQ